MITKQTKARQAVIAILKNHANPLSIEDVLKFVQISLPATAFSTIYRIMKRLEEEGKVVRASWRERGGRYEWTDRLHHHHIHCTVCGETTDIDDTVMHFDSQRITELTGYSFGNHHLVLEGVCPSCQSRLKNPHSSS